MQIVVTDPDSLAVARREVDAELDTIEAAASRFRPDSEINALTASAGRPTRVSELLADLLGAAMTAARQTDGDVDPTIGATMIALGYDRDIATLDHTHPVTASISVPARWSMVTLEDRVVTVPPGILLDLGATAKAIAADRCADRVHRATASGVLINLGGDIATAGPAPDGGWQVLVHDDADDPAGSVALSSGAALATSSTIHRRWRRRADLVHHIVDPHT
ncbi:MAG: FAD:protein transferase, partial [Mycobacterium sp.]|nr:FAD:protein transferase [Mycobacterium sp.]